MAEDPAWARDLLRHLGAEVLLGHGLRRVADTGCGQLLLDWNLQIRPVGFARVADFVRCHHAHNAAPTAWRYGAAITNGASLLGVVMVGNPVARGLMGRGTVEVNRLCIGGGTPQRHLAVEGLGGITRAVAEFGRDVLAANPGASFDIFINMAKGQRKPRGFDDAEKAGTFAHHAFLREDAGEDATSRKLVSPPVAAAAAPAAPAAREGGRGGKRAKRGGVPHPVPRRKGEGLTARRCAAPLPRRRGATAAGEVFGKEHRHGNPSPHRPSWAGPVHPHPRGRCGRADRLHPLQRDLRHRPDDRRRLSHLRCTGGGALPPAGAGRLPPLALHPRSHRAADWPHGVLRGADLGPAARAARAAPSGTPPHRHPRSREPVRNRSMSAVRRFLDLSNAHLSNEDRALLDACAGHDTGELLCASTPYGWFVYACEERPLISDTLWALFQEARRHGCGYLLFDRDAASLDGFPVFDREAEEAATEKAKEEELTEAG
ncbi:XF1762 family protein [Roseomonas mucosa]|uniref:XF1762 family protein n=1 Tax=Roseomonas mucosa TaxID=207340 RepID=UPI001EF43673|nr:XF1762 family protein [Roseomonas mucosa]MCG7353735.1 hypothetical protein [Roseomonas mucosa]